VILNVSSKIQGLLQVWGHHGVVHNNDRWEEKERKKKKKRKEKKRKTINTHSETSIVTIEEYHSGFGHARLRQPP